MSNIVFTPNGWLQYQSWVTENNRRITKKIRELIADIERNGNAGIGKPEPLRGDLEGWWSRRITDEHRLVYAIADDNIYIAKCRSHYN
ncbi:MAG: Txe/YoeB family addiction module toxin [Clostridiales Family XIII bacterium]|nr:Txe/YoeB family addiction module toxin [Clostridiales Family XIII bacterium]